MFKKLFSLMVILPFIGIAQVSVGWDDECTYNLNDNASAIQLAIDAGANEIRLSNQDSHLVALDITNNIILKGGYTNCLSANLGNQSNTNTIIDANGLGMPAVKVRSLNFSNITLDSLTIKNGTGVNDGSTHNWAGGLSIDQVDGQISLNRINLINNTGIKGGGLSVVNFNSSGSLTITANNIAIQSNSAGQAGGGVYCYSAETGFELQIDLVSASTIRDNHSEQHGGGIYADGCQIDFFAGKNIDFVNSNIDKELLRNTAKKSGAGIFAVRESILNMYGSATDAFDILLNESNLDTNVSAGGGGAFVSDLNTELNLINTIVSSNTTGRYGGGIYSLFGATINIESDANGCQYSEFCSQIISNLNTGLFSGGGGAIATRFSGLVNVKNTLIRYNNSQDDGYVLYSSEGIVLFEGNIILENGSNTEFNNQTALYLDTDSNTTLAYNTILRNNSTNTVFRQNSPSSILNIYGNIIEESGTIHSNNSAITDFNCNLISNINSISVPMNNIIEGSVMFFDTLNDNYNLTEADTIAIDVCDSSIYLPSNDFINSPRGIDNPDVLDGLGFYDLGAYEYDDSDLIYKDSFE